MRLLSGHILPRSESNFTHNHLDFKKISPQRNPGPLLTGAGKGKGGDGKGLNGSYSKEVQRERTGEGRYRDGREKEGEGPAAGGDLAPSS